MLLVQILVITSLIHNVHFKAVFVPGHQKILPDLRSRFHMSCVWAAAPDSMEQLPTELPSYLWSISDGKLTTYCQILYH